MTVPSAEERLRSPDDGNAIVEFLAAALLLLVPVVYLSLVMGRLQAATFAAEGGRGRRDGPPRPPSGRRMRAEGP